VPRTGSKAGTEQRAVWTATAHGDEQTYWGADFIQPAFLLSISILAYLFLFLRVYFLFLRVYFYSYVSISILTCLFPFLRVYFYSYVSIPILTCLFLFLHIYFYSYVSMSTIGGMLLPFCEEAGTTSVSDWHLSSPFPRRGKLFTSKKCLSNRNATLVRVKNEQKMCLVNWRADCGHGPLSQPDDKAAPGLPHQYEFTHLHSLCRSEWTRGSTDYRARLAYLTIQYCISWVTH